MIVRERVRSLRPRQIDIHRLRVLLADVTGIIEHPHAYGVRTRAVTLAAAVEAATLLTGPPSTQ